MIDSLNTRIGPLDCDGTQTAFTFNFRVLATTDVAVYVSDELQEKTAYSVTLAATGGTVTFSDAPAYGKNVVILRDIPMTQETDLQNHTALYAETMEEAMDKETMLLQQLAEKVNRAVVVPPSRENGMTTEEFKEEIRSDLDAAVASASGYASAASGYADDAAAAAGYATETEHYMTTASGYMDVAHDYMDYTSEYKDTASSYASGAVVAAANASAAAALAFAGGMPILPLSGGTIRDGKCTLLYENGCVFSGEYPVVSGAATATVFELIPSDTVVSGGRQCTFEMHLRHTSGVTAQFTNSMIYRNSGGVYDPDADSTAIAAVVDTEQNLTIRPVTEGGVMYYMINEATVRKLQTGGN